MATKTKNKKILDTEIGINDSESETEIMYMPTKHFNAMYENNKTKYIQKRTEAEELTAQVKSSNFRLNEVLKRYKDTKSQNEILEKQINIYKGKIKSSPRLEQIVLDDKKQYEEDEKGGSRKRSDEYYNKKLAEADLEFLKMLD